MRKLNVTAILLAAALALGTFAAPVAAQQVTFPAPLFVTSGTNWNITLDDSDPNEGVSYTLVPANGNKSTGWLTLTYSQGDYLLTNIPGGSRMNITISPIPLGKSCPYSRTADNATYTIQVAAGSVTYYGCGYFTQQQ
ncbi:hypothetical protein [Marilutibacter chinensis]|uniref:Uncharacterized protein n=1 Tax=Marilutibacter chinensis TaxID=2912247 RepID=A0ABS9HXQ0_9GAMM|nr:hypothetical protein [Lysobacter chinensis]MCF7223558.1 hypothetical protein [Lysobacter chinensis]